MSNTIVIHGPQGCGKTRSAEALAKHFGCSHIVDDWNGRDKVAPGALVLTNTYEWKASALPSLRRFVPFAKAMGEAGLARVGA